jgi:hypothetical protein
MPPRSLLIGRVSAGAIDPVEHVDPVIRAAWWGGQTVGYEPGTPPSDEQLDAATWWRHHVPDGSVHAFLADHRHELFPPRLFADLVAQGHSHPSVPARSSPA